MRRLPPARSDQLARLPRLRAEGLEEVADDLLAEPPERRPREPLHRQACARHGAVAARRAALRLDDVPDDAPGVHAAIAGAHGEEQRLVVLREGEGPAHVLQEAEPL